MLNDGTPGLCGNTASWPLFDAMNFFTFFFSPGDSEIVWLLSDVGCRDRYTVDDKICIYDK